LNVRIYKHGHPIGYHFYEWSLNVDLISPYSKSSSYISGNWIWLFQINVIIRYLMITSCGQLLFPPLQLKLTSLRFIQLLAVNFSKIKNNSSMNYNLNAQKIDSKVDIIFNQIYSIYNLNSKLNINFICYLFE